MNCEVNCVQQAEILRFMADCGFPAETVLDGVLGNSEYLIEEKNGEILPVNLEYLRNHGNWVSSDLSLRIFKNVARLIGGERPLFWVGRTIYSSKVSGQLGWLIRLLAVHPEWLMTRTADISARLNRVKRVVFDDFNKDTGMRARIRYVDQTGTRSVLICDFSEGGLVGFSSIFAKNVQSSKVRCACEGDECCEYILSWEKRSLPETLFRSVSPGFQLMQDDIESAGLVADEDARTS